MRPLRLTSVLVSLVVLTTVVAGCGSSGSGSSASSTFASELSYFPSGSPLVLTLQTDPNAPAIKHAQGLESKFPLAAFGQAALTSKLQQLGINYSSDIRPLFGNPVLLGVAGATISGSASSNFLVVWTTKDAAALGALLKKIGVQQSVGTRDGAKLYSAGTTSLAVNGPTLVFGPNPTVVAAALDRHAHGGGITTSQFTRETAGLDRSSLSEVFGDLSGVLSTGRAAKARQVPWVAALRGYGVALTTNATGISLRFHLDTTGRSLTASQLPFAAGSSAPTLAGTAPIAAGIHDPAQIISFVEAAAQQTGDASYLRFLGRQSQLRAKTGVDLNAIASKFTGDLLIDSDTHVTMARAAVSDPTTVAADLARAMSDPRDLFSSTATRVHKLSGGFYAVVGPKRTINVGLAGGQLLIGKASPAALRAFGSSPTTTAIGAQGTTAFRITLPELLRLTLHKTLPQYARTILSQLGDVTGWAASSPSGIDGNASLSIK